MNFIEDPDHRNTAQSDGRILFAVLAVWIFIIWFADQRYQPVAPLTANAHARLFSAARAEPILKRLVADPIPRNAGSQQNEIVRNRIVAILESFSYEVQIQQGVGVVSSSVRDRSPEKDKVPIANILTRLKGRISKPAILLAAHYDSVPFGPGASDDGVGAAAVIEIARMLAAESPPERDVIFLLTDGEELGLLGAKLFVDEHDWASDVEVAINLEARGTSGPSLMFQTSSNSRLLVPLFSRASSKPFSSSLFYEIYKRLRNDTDFTVFNQAGMQGYNFAFIGDVKNYHSEDDNLQNVDLGCLQHHGENALGLIRELMHPDWTRQPNEAKERAVYFDLFGWTLFWWPENWSLVLSGAACGLMAGFLGLNKWLEKKISTADEPEIAPKLLHSNALNSIIGFLAVLLLLTMVYGLGLLLLKLASFDARLRNLWPTHPLPYAVGFWLAGFSLLCVGSLTLLRKQTPQSVTICVAAVWLTLSVFTSLLLTGGSHLFVVPVVSLGLIGLFALWSDSDSRWKWLAILFPLIVGVMWLPLEGLFYDAVGFRMSNLMLVRISIVTSALLPAIKFLDPPAVFKWSLAGSCGAVIAFALAIFLNSAN